MMPDRLKVGSPIGLWVLVTACQVPTAVTPCRFDSDCPAEYFCDPIGAYCLSRGAAPDAGADRVVVEDAGLSPDRHRFWTRVADADQPGGLHGPKAAFHRALGQVMLYGGSTDVDWGPYSAALWRYDGTAWTCECAACAPGPRWGHGLVYDAAGDRLLLYGGRADGTSSTSDLWEWTEAGGFVQLYPSGASPAPRHGMYAAYDEARDRMVVFGGRRADIGATSDLWEYDGGQWHQIATTVPWPTRRFDSGQVATYDRLGRGFVIYAGDNGSGGVRDDMWSWDGVAWAQRCGACTGADRLAPGFAYDGTTGRIVMQGGFTTDEEAGTWESRGAGFVLVDPIWPTARDTAALVYDERRGVFVLYGGNRDGSGGNLAETYEYR
ncbi:MAG: hypothetical protein JXR83_21530 [Deltaproteobacteria bacterium]|nr:hypothetical protein [Deltaproteobacteria bacterium]